MTRTLDQHGLELVATRFRVLGDGMRLRLLQILREGARTVSDLAEAAQTSQPNVSKHLRVLEEAGFVRRRPAGGSVRCEIADPGVFKLCELVCGGLERQLAEHAQRLRPPAASRRRA